ncbi:MAG: histidinol-phosphatase HisJ family protein [Clostridia bacterium]|nr:histidinol-phosphatase HisJ family protein [Clostridia bacterium]
MPAYPDFHLHSEASFDGQAPLSAMWQAAQARGLPAIAVTDHVEMTAFEKEHFADDAAASAAAAQELQARIGTQAPRLALGLELGEPLDNLPATQALLRSHPYDFVLGSLHNLSDGLDYYYYDYSDKDLDALLQEYYEAVLRMVEWGGFQSLAHLTYPLRYFPQGRPHRNAADFPILDDIFAAMVRRHIALEINTSGLRKGMGATMPSAAIVQRFYRAGGRLITFGSDAHAPQDVGADLDAAAAVARQAGFTHVAAFFRQEPVLFEL